MNAEIKIFGRDGSFDRASGILSSIFENYEWQSDTETFGRSEWWLGYMEQLKAKKVIRDDCDGFSGLVLDLLFFLGGFQLHNMAECLVDVKKDDKPFDHHAGAVRVSGVWFYFHCWSPQLLTKEKMVRGTYILENGNKAAPLFIFEHRLCTGGLSDWKGGPPQ